MIGQLDILNVGSGDVKLVFNQADPAEIERAKGIVTDMLKRGFAIVVRLEDDTYQRISEFDTNRGVYIIAEGQPATEPPSKDKPAAAKRKGRPKRELPMGTTQATAIGRSAGG